MTQSPPLVAIVDDDAKVLESLADFLESAGFLVCAFTSAVALLSDSRLTKIDCLITDIVMPGMDGVALTKEATLRRPELPIFYITGNQEMITLAESTASCRERVFKKPFNSGALLSALQAAL